MLTTLLVLFWTYGLEGLAFHFTPAHDATRAQVLGAMDLVAESAMPGGLPALMERWGQDPLETAEAITHAAHAHGIDPLVLVAIAYRESKFKLTAEGDYTADGEPRNCGPTQVRVVIRNRPSCDALKSGPHFAYNWTARFIAGFPPHLGLSPYNGAAYARRVERRASWIRTRLSSRESAMEDRYSSSRAGPTITSRRLGRHRTRQDPPSRTARQ